MEAERGLYVGYLPMPRRHARLVRVVVPALLAAFAALGAALAVAQRTPGNAVWETGEAGEFEGTLVSQPYPMLVGDDGAVLFLVEVGKRGSAERLAREAAGLVGSRVRVSGWTLRRDEAGAERRMVELMPGPAAIVPVDAAARAWTLEGPGEAVRLAGEILDGKCYLGAMKPGDGRAHRACATLCIDGGIPPMLYGRGADGRLRLVVLTDAGGGPAGPVVRAVLGEPVVVEGVLRRIGGAEWLAVERVRPG
jgi:hypothetical protein